MSEKKFAKEDLVEMYEAEKALNIKVFHDYLSEYEVGTKSFKTVCNTSRYTKKPHYGNDKFFKSSWGYIRRKIYE